MSLSIQTITFNNFRNYSSAEFSIPEGITIIIGDNAVGKTNIIEGIQLLTRYDSFRNPSWNDVITWGETRGSAKLEIRGEERYLELEVVFEEGKRSYYLNGKKKRAGNMHGLLPAVLFIPDDLQLVKGPMEQRRNTLDDVGVQLSHTYSTIKSDYEKIVRQRNILLKEESFTKDVLEAWNESLIHIGASLLHHRIKLYKRITDHMIEIFPSLSQRERFKAEYISSWNSYIDTQDLPSEDELMHYTKEDIETLLHQGFDNAREDEIRKRKTVVGPHRDEISFFINDRNARIYGSQGQQRTIALAWKIAEVEIITQIYNQPPILLLDDVMSELDEHRRDALLQMVKRTTQTIITTTNPEYFSHTILDQANVLNLS